MTRAALVAQLKALGEPNRLAVAALLADREWGAGELLAHLRLSQPSLSRHLKVLREAGVVVERRTGRHAYYRLADEELPRLVVSLATGPAREGSGPRPSGRAQDGEKMFERESVEDKPSPEPEDQPRSADIEEWLL